MACAAPPRSRALEPYAGGEPSNFQIPTSDGRLRPAHRAGILAFEIEGVASRNRSGEPFYIDNTAHPANRRLALARARKTEVQGFGLALSLAGKGNNGHFAPFAWAA